MPIYMTYWQASRNDIDEIDKMGTDSAAGGQQLARRIDFSGIDKMIRAANADIHLAQRFRSNSDDYSVGFTIRSKTGGDARSERERLMDNYLNKGNYPRVYSLGIALENRRTLESDGFERFYLVDVSVFLNALHNETIEPSNAFDNGDGSAGEAYDIADLVGIGAIDEVWDRQELEQVYEQNRVNRQSNLKAFASDSVTCPNCDRSHEPHVRICYYCGVDLR